MPSLLAANCAFHSNLTEDITQHFYYAFYSQFSSFWSCLGLGHNCYPFWYPGFRTPRAEQRSLLVLTPILSFAAICASSAVFDRCGRKALSSVSDSEKIPNTTNYSPVLPMSQLNPFGLRFLLTACDCCLPGVGHLGRACARWMAQLEGPTWHSDGRCFQIMSSEVYIKRWCLHLLVCVLQSVVTSVSKVGSLMQLKSLPTLIIS